MKIILISILVLIANVCINAQSFFSDFEKAKIIKLLETNIKDVEKILGKEDFKHFNYSGSGYFYTNSSIIRINYTTGDCPNEDEDWNVEEGLVSEVSISPKDWIEIDSIGIDYSKFRREKLSGKSPKNRFVYQDKTSGIAIGVRGKKVEAVSYFPPKEKYSQLCEKKEVKKYYYGKKIERYPLSKEAILDYNFASEVTDLKLSQTEIIADCDLSNIERKQECLDNKKISVAVSANDPENDVLTYSFEVSGGKIIGEGKNVVWDLSEVESGTYKIAAFTDDGCGSYCGKWMTKSVVIK